MSKIRTVITCSKCGKTKEFPYAIEEPQKSNDRTFLSQSQIVDVRNINSRFVDIWMFVPKFRIVRNPHEHFLTNVCYGNEILCPECIDEYINFLNTVSQEFTQTLNLFWQKENEKI